MVGKDWFETWRFVAKRWQPLIPAAHQLADAGSVTPATSWFILAEDGTPGDENVNL